MHNKQTEPKKYVVVESINQGMAKVEAENGEASLVSLSTLPAGVQNGDWILVTDEGMAIDRGKTDSQKKKSTELFKKLIKE